MEHKEQRDIKASCLYKEISWIDSWKTFCETNGLYSVECKLVGLLGHRDFHFPFPCLLLLGNFCLFALLCCPFSANIMDVDFFVGSSTSRWNTDTQM